MTLAPARVEMFTEMGHRVRGIIHVGANDGEEFPWYLHRGYTPVLAFEPIPEVFEQLQESYPEVTCVNVALGDWERQQLLHIPRHLHDETDDTPSSSLLQPDYNSPYEWGERGKVYRDVQVSVRRFDSWALTDGAGITLGQFNTVVIDAQGFELEVLQGFGDRLRDFELLSIEMSEVPIYDGEAPAQTVVSWLGQRGFAQLTPIQPHDDVLFQRVAFDPRRFRWEDAVEPTQANQDSDF